MYTPSRSSLVNSVDYFMETDVSIFILNKRKSLVKMFLFFINTDQKLYLWTFLIDFCEKALARCYFSDDL